MLMVKFIMIKLLVMPKMMMKMTMVVSKMNGDNHDDDGDGDDDDDGDASPCDDSEPASQRGEKVRPSNRPGKGCSASSSLLSW